MNKRISFILAAALAMNFFGMVAPARAVWTIIPDVVGMTEAEAISKINSTPYHTVGNISRERSWTVAIGHVISQDPAGGTWTDFAESVDLVISLGRYVWIPDVSGMSVSDAESAIIAADLIVSGTRDTYTDTTPVGYVAGTDPRGGTSIVMGSSVTLLVSIGPGRMAPNVVGMSLATASSAITSKGLVVGTISYEHSNTVPNGHVISQDPPAPMYVPLGGDVNLVISLGPRLVTVPDVVGMTQAASSLAITSAGLVVGTKTHAYSDTVAVGHVISQNPSGGTSVPEGSDVNLVISLGPPAPEAIEVPDVVGMSETEAGSAINSVGLHASYSYEYSDTVEEGHVIHQHPSGGTSVPEGSGVDLTISRGSQQPGDSPTDPDQPVPGVLVPIPPDENCLLAHWKLDDGSGNTAVDSSGNGFDITLHNTTWEDGVFGGAIHFNGVGYGNLRNFNYSDNVITVCAWVFHDEFRTFKIERYVTLGPEIAVIRKEYDGRLHFYINTDGNFRHLWVDDVLNEGQWHHVAGTWDGLDQRLYIDGVEIASQRPGGVLGSASNVEISSQGEFLNGMLDDVRIYNCALSAENILSLLYPEPIECLIAHWKLDETSGQIAYDSISYHDGILYGNPIWQPTGGILGGALEFDGIDDYVQIPRVVQDNFTLMAWIKTDTPGIELGGQGYQGSGLIWSDVGGVANDFILAVLGTKLSFFCGNPDLSVNSDRDVVTGQWVHIAAIRNLQERQISIYIDGEHEKTIDHGNTNPLNAHDIIAVGGNVLDSYYYTGLIDDLRIYDCVLDEIQIKSLMIPSPSIPSLPSLSPLSNALDTSLSFTTGGDEDWFSQTATYYHNGNAAQSGGITHDQESWLQTTVNGPGTLSFYWKVSSEGNYDCLEFCIDGTLQDQISESEDWHNMTYEITGSALHILEWRYFKDGSMSRGYDCGWVDNVVWVPTP